MASYQSPGVSGFSRRHFVKGLAAGGVMLSNAGLIVPTSYANNIAVPAVLTGNEFHLTIDNTIANFTGTPTRALAINGSIPAPTLVWREGETVTIHVTNKLNTSTSIHWHGIILPFQMDGVPGISFRGIAPGETFSYQFTVKQNGTYWYHSHTGFQELKGMYGAIIIIPRDGERIKADREFIVQLSDWTDDDPMSILAKLKKQSDFSNFNQPTAVDFFNDIKQNGIVTALADRKMWNEMRMNPTDLADISAHTFTFLMNGTTPNANWTGLFKAKEKIRIRCINASSNTFFDMRIPGLKLTIVQADGQDVEPISVDEFRSGPGESYDFLIEPKDDAYTIFAQSIDRSGYACGTLAVARGLTAVVPAMDEPEWLTMQDMMGNMDHGKHGQMAIDHSKHVDHKGMDHNSTDHNSIDHSQHSMMQMHDPLKKPSKTVRHASTEFGPSVDMRVDMPRTNLDDPGIGLRNNGRRVLTLADLHTIGGAMDTRAPERELELHLTGNMERYSWSFDGLEFGKSTPVHFKYGEKIRIILQNDTMMTHPMHLHGVWSELENDKGEFVARLHTIAVQPAQRISFQVSADAIGRWAWHCHLAFHMDAGMFREVVIA